MVGGGFSGAGCNQRHEADDPCFGQAVNPDRLVYTVRVGYDVSAVIGGGWS